MATGYDPISGSIHFPRLSVLKSTVSELGSTNPEDTPVGLTRDGRILTKAAFVSHNSLTGGWLTWGTLKDKKTQETFEECQSNMQKALEHYRPLGTLGARTIKKISVSNTPTLSEVHSASSILSQMPQFASISDSIPSLTLAQVDELCVFLQEQGANLSSDNARRLAIEMYIIDPEKTNQLSGRINGKADINNSAVQALYRELKQACDTAECSLPKSNPPVTQTEIVSNTANIKEATVGDMTFKTVGNPKQLPGGIANPKITTEEWDALEYQVKTSPVEVSEELRNNRDAAITAQSQEAPKNPEKFKQLLATDIPQHNYLKNKEISCSTGSFKDNPGAVFSETAGGSPSMEDASASCLVFCSVGSYWLPIRLTAVADGHGDEQAANATIAAIAPCLKARLEQFCGGGLTEAGITEAVSAAIADLDRIRRFDETGTTFNLACVIGDRLCIANVGDSRAILVTPKGECVQLSEDAKLLPEDEGSEEDRSAAKASRFNRAVHLRGGTIESQRDPKTQAFELVRVKGPGVDRGTSSAATIGDHHHNGALTAQPTIVMIPLDELDKDSLILQMSDGVTDAISTNQIGEIAQQYFMKGQLTICEKVRDCAYSMLPKDNIMVTGTPLKTFRLL